MLHFPSGIHAKNHPLKSSASANLGGGIVRMDKQTDRQTSCKILICPSEGPVEVSYQASPIDSNDTERQTDRQTDRQTERKQYKPLTNVSACKYSCTVICLINLSNRKAGIYHPTDNTHTKKQFLSCRWMSLNLCEYCIFNL